MIWRMGERMNDPSSICYWAFKNQIPIFCPAITDGSIGDMLFFHSYKSPGLVVDLVQDIRGTPPPRRPPPQAPALAAAEAPLSSSGINRMAVDAKRSGMLIFGGGLVKHHICNANLMRNGADHAIFVNTGQDFDGSDSGAKPDEAVSWGKVRPEAKPVKICAEATLIMPLLVAQTFARLA